jgi:hypothetical protein
MPRPTYRQDPLPLGDCTPPPTLYGPEQPLPPGLERIEQGQLGVVPLGPLFACAGITAAAEAPEQEGRADNLSIWKATAASADGSAPEPPGASAEDRSG